MVVGPILSQRPFTSTISKFADDPWFTGRGYLLKKSENGTGFASDFAGLVHFSCVPLSSHGWNFYREMSPIKYGGVSVYF
jgi:hypothetical protein